MDELGPQPISATLTSAKQRDMKFLLLAFLVAFGLDSILSASVVIKNNTVYVDEKPVDLKKLTIVEDMPHAKRYLYQTGDTNITITKSKFGNAIAVSTVSKLTPEEAKKVEEYNKKIADKVVKKVTEFQSQVDSQIKEIHDKIQANLQNVFKSFPTFGFPF